MHTTLRNAGILMLGVLGGAALAAGGAYAYGQTRAGQAQLRDFLAARISAEYAVEAATTSLMQMPPTLPVPASYVTTDYFTAINNVLADIVLISNASVELEPVLTSLDRQMLVCSYDGFYDRMGHARALSNKNQALAAQFLMHLGALEAANVKTSDAITKSGTFTVVTVGRTLGGAIQDYATAVQELLYGGTPSAKQIDDLKGKVATAQASSLSFADALKPLVERLVEGDKAALQAASSTPAKK